MPDVDDSELRCLECDYDLRGLTENRCPECGTPFDPEELRAIAAGEPQSVPSDSTGNFFADSMLIWWRVISRPREFARRFPPRHVSGRAIEYSLACYAFAGFLFAVTLLLRPGGGGFPLAVVIPAVILGSSFASWLCEAVTATLLEDLVRPTRASQAYHFWRGITHYASGFTILTGLWGGIAGPAVFDWPWTSYSNWGVAAAGIIFIWWATTLGRMVVARSAPGLRRVLGCLVILLLGLVAIFVGTLTSYLLGLRLAL
jgi:hypothetical protein